MTDDLISWAGLTRAAVVFAVVAGTAIAVWLRKRSSRHWPITFGKVEHASSFEDGFNWLTDVSYSYSVEKDFYSGQFQLRSRGEKKANEQELRWKGTQHRDSPFPTRSENLCGTSRRPSWFAWGRVSRPRSAWVEFPLGRAKLDLLQLGVFRFRLQQ